MSIENEIKQSKRIQSEKIRLTVNLMFTGSWAHSISNQHFKQFGFTSHEQYNVLRILRGTHPKTLCVSEVQSRMVDRGSNVTRIVSKLVEKNWVIRSENNENRRIVNLSISPSALVLLAEIDDSLNLVENQMNNITTEEAELLNTLLDKLRG